MIYILIVVGIIVGERLIKGYIEENKVQGKEEPLYKDKIVLTKYHNKGAAFNLLATKGKTVVWVTASVIGILLLLFAHLLGKKGYHVTKLALSFILGGAFSNLLDRFERGYVIDYFRFTKGKGLKNLVFNLADMFIFIGGIIIMIQSIVKKN